MSTCLDIENSSIVKHTIDPLISTTIGAIAAPLFTVHPVAGALFGLTNSLAQKGLYKIAKEITNPLARIRFIAIVKFAAIALAFVTVLLLSAHITVIGAIALTFLSAGAKEFLTSTYSAFRTCIGPQPTSQQMLMNYAKDAMNLV